MSGRQTDAEPGSPLASWERARHKDAVVFPRKSRWPLAIVLCAGVLLIGALAATLGWDRAWRVWNVPVAVQPFFDAQVIAAGGSSWADGHDPLRFNPHDLGRRPMNYPRVWHGLFVLGLRHEHAVALGWTLAGLLLAGVWLALPALDWAESLLVGLGVFSPAVLLGVERGNSDLAVFFVLAVALAVPRTAWNAAWIAVAFALKFFPLAAAVLLLGRARREALIGWGVLSVFAAIYLAGSWQDLRLISAATPRDDWLSFGLNVLPVRLARTSALASVIAQGTGWLASGLIVLQALRARTKAVPEETAQDDAALDAFRVGAACFVATFLLGNNFIYRLVFVVPTLPQLWRWARTGPKRAWAAAGVVATLVSLWLLAFDRESWIVPRDEWRWFVLGQAANWTLFIAFCHLLASTLPSWVSGCARMGDRLE